MVVTMINHGCLDIKKYRFMETFGLWWFMLMINDGKRRLMMVIRTNNPHKCGMIRVNLNHPYLIHIWETNIHKYR